MAMDLLRLVKRATCAELVTGIGDRERYGRVSASDALADDSWACASCGDYADWTDAGSPASATPTPALCDRCLAARIAYGVAETEPLESFALGMSAATLATTSAGAR